MADEPDNAPNEQDDDVLELGEGQQTNTDVNDEGEAGEAAEADDEDAPLVIALDTDEDETEVENPTVRQLRERERDLKRQLKEAKEQLAPKPVELGPEPVWNDDTQHLWDYDPDKYLADRQDWEKRRDQAKDQERSQEQARAAQAEKQRQTQSVYLQKAASFQARAKITPEQYREQEEHFVESLGEPEHRDMLKSLVLEGLDNVPLLVFAMKTNPKKAAAIAAIESPVKRFAALVRLHDQAESAVTTKRKAPPAPEERLTGSGSFGGSRDKEDARMLEKAQKSGDMTAYRQWKKARKA